MHATTPARDTYFLNGNQDTGEHHNANWIMEKLMKVLYLCCICMLVTDRIIIFILMFARQFRLLGRKGGWQQFQIVQML